MATSNTVNPPNRIADFYRGSSVFITGGAGFLGKVLIEKLLRSTNVKAIYLLLRPKKGKSPQERIGEIFSNMLYDKLKAERPDAIKKVKAIAGDITSENLGISLEDRKMIQNEVEFIFHSAASTRFDISLLEAIKMNTRGTKYILDLASECKKLKALIHVSTAYAYPKEKVLYEKAYKPPADPHEVLNAINLFSKDDDGTLSKRLLGDCPNTYTFSKACAEALVVEQLDKIPAVIVRPSIVCPTIYEPIPGWCNNLQGPMGLFVGAGKGIIRSMYINSQSYADFVPADMAISGFLIAPWFAKQRKDARIVNLTASSEYNFTWEEIIEEGKYVIYNVMPFNGVVWYPGGSMKKSRFIHNICFIFFQLIPAIFLDALLIVLGYKPLLYNIQRRIQKGGEMFEYYTTKAWNFSNAMRDHCLEVMNEVEKKEFPVEPRNFNIRNYFTDCMHTVRKNNLKESDDTLPGAKRHMKIMYFVDKIVTIGLAIMFFYYLYHWTQPLYKRFAQ